MKRLHDFILRCGTTLTTRFSAEQRHTAERIRNIMDNRRKSPALPLVAATLVCSLLSGMIVSCRPQSNPPEVPTDPVTDPATDPATSEPAVNEPDPSQESVLKVLSNEGNLIIETLAVPDETRFDFDERYTLFSYRGSIRVLDKSLGCFVPADIGGAANLSGYRSAERDATGFYLTANGTNEALRITRTDTGLTSEWVTREKKQTIYPRAQAFFAAPDGSGLVYQMETDISGHSEIVFETSDGTRTTLLRSVLLGDLLPNGKEANLEDVHSYRLLGFLDATRIVCCCVAYEGIYGIGIYDLTTGELNLMREVPIGIANGWLYYYVVDRTRTDGEYDFSYVYPVSGIARVNGNGKTERLITDDIDTSWDFHISETGLLYSIKEELIENDWKGTYIASFYDPQTGALLAEISYPKAITTSMLESSSLSNYSNRVTLLLPTTLDGLTVLRDDINLHIEARRVPEMQTVLINDDLWQTESFAGDRSGRVLNLDSHFSLLIGTESLMLYDREKGTVTEEIPSSPRVKEILRDRSTFLRFSEYDGCCYLTRGESDEAIRIMPMKNGSYAADIAALPRSEEIGIRIAAPDGSGWICERYTDDFGRSDIVWQTPGKEDTILLRGAEIDLFFAEGNAEQAQNQRHYLPLGFLDSTHFVCRIAKSAPIPGFVICDITTGKIAKYEDIPFGCADGYVYCYVPEDSRDAKFDSTDFFYRSIDRIGADGSRETLLSRGDHIRNGTYHVSDFTPLYYLSTMKLKKLPNREIHNAVMYDRTTGNHLGTFYYDAGLCIPVFGQNLVTALIEPSAEERGEMSRVE